MKKKLMILLLTFCYTFPVFGIKVGCMCDYNQLQLEGCVSRNDRVLWIGSIIVFTLFGFTGYNMYKVKKFEDELAMKETELKARYERVLGESRKLVEKQQ
jgi:type III secretory pathway component EscU